MGIWVSRLLSYFGDQEARILVLGLDNAGKTTILCKCSIPIGRVNSFARLAPSFQQLHIAPSLLVGVSAPYEPPAAICLSRCADRLQVGEVVSTIPSELTLLFSPASTFRHGKLDKGTLQPGG